MPPPARTAPPPSKRSSPPTTSSPRVRPRKTYGSVSATPIDTSASAHLRTDPVKALSTLLRLLSSLPSRIGGCQYKLTPAEHALSLHLVSIVDPFVHHGVRALNLAKAPSSASAVATGLIQQPTEILDAIFFHVDARRDLLNVGLACRRLHDVVFPRHFDYRVIRCKVSSISVWNHLILHKSLARNVRKVEIIDERSAVSSSTSQRSSGSTVIIPRGILHSDTDLESSDDELRMHAKQEKYLSASLLRMTGLKEFKWSCNHSPISIANVWPTLMMRAAGLRVLDISDNLVFASKIVDVDGRDTEESSGEDTEDENAESERRKSAKGSMNRPPPSSLRLMTNVTFRSTSHSYGAAKQPELNRISTMLHQCVNLKTLEITYTAPRAPGATGLQGSPSRTRPLADELLMYSRWSSLTSLTLTNLRCASSEAPVTFLAAHHNLEVLHIDIIIPTGGLSSAGNNLLPDGSLPRLKEIKASKEIINAILECPCVGRRPLESIKGFRLSGHPSGGSSATTINQATSARSIPDALFLSNLKSHSSSIRRIELAGWHDMEDIRKITPCVPNVQHLDIGRRLGAAAQRNISNIGNASTSGPAANIIEWTELLATLPELVTMHGVKFFYEVSSAPVGISSSSAATLSSNSLSDPISGPPTPTPSSAPSAAVQSSFSVKPAQMSMMERSRMRKNDEIAGVLAWKCKKLRRVDHWEDGGGKVVVLLKDHDEASGIGAGGKDKVRWEVRRVKL